MDYGLKTWLASYRWSHSSCNWRAWGFRFISIPIGMNSRTRIGNECVLGWMLLVHLTCWVNIQEIVKQIQEWLCNCCCCWQILCNHHHHHRVMLLSSSSSMCVLNWTTSICKWSVHRVDITRESICFTWYITHDGIVIRWWNEFCICYRNNTTCLSTNMLIWRSTSTGTRELS